MSLGFGRRIHGMVNPGYSGKHPISRRYPYKDKDDDKLPAAISKRGMKNKTG